MRRNFKKLSLLFLFILFLLSTSLTTSAQTISNIEIDPELDISIFSPYKIKAQVSDSPISVTTEVSTLNGDGFSYWNYYVDGTPVSTSITKTMTYNEVENKYISQNIYPDDIYPEIFFAPSSITYSIYPLETNVRRANYHLFHFDNPFTMTASSSFFIEVNAKPRAAVNSADLNVYLVKNNKSITFFNSNWLDVSNPDVELVGTFDKNAIFHHIHNVTTSSAHHLVPLMTNDDGTVGSKNLDINGDFWIVLYSNSPNIARGWDLRYQSSANCPTTAGHWYTGNQSGWSTTVQSGCPDVHIHLARRDLNYLDQVVATTTATYAGDVILTESETFSFATLPNLPPNSTSFISPVAGGVYNGDEINEILISWNPATDPNNDNLDYTIYVNNGSATTTLVTATTSTSFIWDITSVDDGTYNLVGKICDNNETPLCTNFELTSSFVIERSLPTYSLSNIEIYSNNTVSNLAKAGDTVYLEFESSGDISDTLLVEFFSGGNSLNNSVSYASSADVWTVSYVVDQDDVNGSVDYVITADNLDLQYSSSTPLIIDTIPPSAVVASPDAGTYDEVIEVTLISNGSSEIRYSLDADLDNCSSGQQYLVPINITESKTLKAISCDQAGNVSDIVSFVYVIEISDDENNDEETEDDQLSNQTRRPPATGSRIAINQINQVRNVLNQTQLSPDLKNLIEVLFSLGLIDSSKINLLVNVTISNNQNNNLIFYRDLETGMEDDDVRQLQIFLNRNGFILATEGPGSIGNETNRFGALTRSALIKFQQANNITPAVGFFGPITRGVVNQKNSNF